MTYKLFAILQWRLELSKLPTLPLNYNHKLIHRKVGEITQHSFLLSTTVITASDGLHQNTNSNYDVCWSRSQLGLQYVQKLKNLVLPFTVACWCNFFLLQTLNSRIFLFFIIILVCSFLQLLCLCFLVFILALIMKAPCFIFFFYCCSFKFIIWLGCLGLFLPSSSSIILSLIVDWCQFCKLSSMPFTSWVSHLLRCSMHYFHINS